MGQIFNLPIPSLEGCPSRLGAAKRRRKGGVGSPDHQFHSVIPCFSKNRFFDLPWNPEIMSINSVWT